MAAADDDGVVLCAHRFLRSFDCDPRFRLRPCRERASILIIARSDKLPVTRVPAEARGGCEDPVPIGTAVHARTFPLCESLNYREWSGYYAVSAYEAHHEHEYNAIRNAAALIDVSPLFKYRVTGTRRDAPRRSHHHARRCEDGGRPGLLHALVRRARQGDRRRHRLAPGGERLPLDGRRSEPALVPAERRAASTSRSRTSRKSVAALALQGPTSGRLLEAVAEADVENLKYFRVTQRQDRRRAGRHLAHRLHRRPRLRDLDAVGRTPSRCGTR